MEAIDDTRRVPYGTRVMVRIRLEDIDRAGYIKRCKYGLDYIAMTATVTRGIYSGITWPCWIPLPIYRQRNVLEDNERMFADRGEWTLLDMLYAARKIRKSTRRIHLMCDDFENLHDIEIPILVGVKKKPLIDKNGAYHFGLNNILCVYTPDTAEYAKVKEYGAIYPMEWLGNKVIMQHTTIVCDSLEKKPYKFAECGFKGSLQTKRLEIGDYSILGYEDSFAVERKAADDLLVTLTKNIKYFENECQRGANLDAFALIIEANKGFCHWYTMEAMRLARKYRIELIWCGNRKNAELATLNWLESCLQFGIGEKK